MLILTLRTDNPEAEIGLYKDQVPLAYLKWPAHRELAETLHLKIKEMLDGQAKGLHDLEGIVAYKGPGSFTGLRIGLTVANALAYSLQIKIAGATGEKWQFEGINQILAGKGELQILPDYGAEPHITRPKK